MSKVISKLIKKTISCIFCLLILGLFITCDDPNNPFTNNMGEKVVVEPPTINIEYPPSGAFLPGDVTDEYLPRDGVVRISGTARAYIKIEKIEWKVFANKMYNQKETSWSTAGINLQGGDAKEKRWSFDFDTTNFNGGKDGFIEIQFRVWDTKASADSVKYIYVIKNNPSEIKLAAPAADDIVDPTPADEDVPKINYAGEIRGQVIDQRGLRPGYPQIKIWQFGDPEPDDDDLTKGYATLFLPGIGSDKIPEGETDPIGWDKIDKDMGTHLGDYADRSKMRVVNAAPFSFKLAKFDIEVDSNDPNVRYIRYKRKAANEFDNYESGVAYFFRIRTRDVEPDLTKGSIPNLASTKFIEGIFPPYGFGGPDEDPLEKHPLNPPSTDIMVGRDEPIKIVIYSSNSRPTIEINNDDLNPSNFNPVPSAGGDINKIVRDITNNPNPYITEENSKKIEVEKVSTKTNFRLRLKIIQPNGFKGVTLDWKHEASGRYGSLQWDQPDGVDFTDPFNAAIKGRYYTFTAKGDLKETDSTLLWNNQPIFTTNINPYELKVTVKANDGTTADKRIVVIMDGKNPDISIRSIKGGVGDLGAGAVEYENGLKNDKAYTVNGNIQVVVDRTDNSGIMTYSTGRGTVPTGDDGSYPMVKWIVEPVTGATPETTAAPDTTSTTSSILARLKEYKTNPSPANLQFFNNITDSPPAPVAPALASGWVRRSIPDSLIAEDRANHFKINTLPLNSDPTAKKYFWLYVIAQDGVQNLGFVVQKICVDQSTDYPRITTTTLYKENANSPPVTINGPRELDIDVTVNADGSRTQTGNVSSGTPRRNVLERGRGIQLSFQDDDGIDLAGGDIRIWLTDLNVDSPTAVQIPVRQGVVDGIEQVIRSGNKKNWSGTLSQELMAKTLYGSDYKGDLKDGMYEIRFEVFDNKGDKVEITPHVNTGDDPDVKTADDTYRFAVFTTLPVLKIIYPDDNALGSKNPITIYGTVTSRFLIRSVWITFTPDVISKVDAPSTPASLPLYSDETYTTKIVGSPTDSTLTAPTRGADGLYTYYWRMENVSFDPDGLSTTAKARRFSVETYDRLGNMSNVVRTMQINNTAPVVTLTEFNKGRPPENGKRIVYGKVSFTVSVNAPNGLNDIDGYSGIRWWVLPIGSADPVWTTPFTTIAYTGGWIGGGEFLSGQAYTGIIDTRKLTDEAEYKLCVIAMDKAGNLSSRNITIPPATTPTAVNYYETFKVDWSRDWPVIYPDALEPAPDDVIKEVKEISGTVSDLDLFDINKRDSYVEIRFPKAGVTGAPAQDSADWESWIPVTIPEKYKSSTGGIDPSGAIVFKFETTGYPYFSGDGVKYYQIRVTDEPFEGGGSLGKNPDKAMDGIAYPNYPPTTSKYRYEEDPAKTKIFPAWNSGDPEEKRTYKFFVDATDPEIFFDNYDPTVGHPGYNKNRPTYSSWADLKAALLGQVKEYKLSTLSLTWSGKDNNSNPDDDSITVVLKNNPPDPNPSGWYDWSLSSTDLSATDEAKLAAFFEKALQGMQIIVMEAEDMVSRRGRVSWMFYKDTEGPVITFNITRSIWRNYPNAKFTAPDSSLLNGATLVSIPNAGDFSSLSTNPWPYDFRYGPKWKADSVWATFRKNYGVDYWSSEYAFLKVAQDIVDKLTKENNDQPSTRTGDPESMKSETGYNPPFIEGTFSDEYSSVMERDSQGNPKETFFYYRFRYKSGKLQDIPSSGLEGVTPGTGDNAGWIQKEITAGQTEKTANWKINLNAANGFTGPDGENWLDIRVADTGGNLSEIFNLRFLVDRAAPLLGGYVDDVFKNGEFLIADIANYPSPGWGEPKWVPEIERVFSADGVTGSPAPNDPAFIIEGKVSDYNLSSLQVTIGQEGSTYTIFASLEIDPTAAKAPLPGAGASGVVLPRATDTINGAIDTAIGTTIDAKTIVSRLQITGLEELDDGTPEWTWQLEIRHKDVKELRFAAGSAENSIRRYIRVTASDKAQKRATPPEWFFYLDVNKPTLEYTNLEKGGEGYCASFENENFTLSGQVTDDTKIRDVQYMIARWEYAESGTDKWRWWNSGTKKWEDTVPPNPKTWPSAFKSANSERNDPKRQTSMNWYINQETLNAQPENTFFENSAEKKLFEQEGWYRIDLYITDYSLGSGNPHYTYHAGDYVVPTVPADAANSFKDASYATDNNKSGRAFYIDKKDPTLRWTDPDDKTYYRNDVNNQVPFGFIAGDGNTISSWEAVVIDSDTKLPVTNGTTIWKAGTSAGTSIAIPVPATVFPTDPTGALISDISIDERYYAIMPYMTSTGTGMGSPLDKVDPDPNAPPKKYTITITVTDGAKRTSSISKTFNLDNKPPVFVEEKFSPPSYDIAKDTTWDAVTGRFNVRGNTTDNSNQIRRVAFFVPQAGPAGASSFTFPDASTINDATDSNPNGWHWHDTNYAGSYKIDIGSTTFIYVEEGTFAWRVVVPQTSLFYSNATARNYVQWVKIGTGTYKDVVIDKDTGAATPSAPSVPALTFPGIPDDKKIYNGEDVGMITVYMLAEDAAGNVAYKALKYWIWPEGDRPIVTAINNPDSTKIKAERMLNGSIRISGMAKDNERVKNVWFRVLKTDGTPYDLKFIPEWDETWEAIPGQYQIATDASPSGSMTNIGSLKSTDSIAAPTGGWYKANGGNSNDVSWWAYINNDGELNPTGTQDMNEIIIEVRAQDVTWDDSKQDWMTYISDYNGMASAMTDVSRVTAWVVAGAPEFERPAQLAPVDSKTADGDSSTVPPKPVLWVDLDKINIRNRSAYKVTVKHKLGLSAIRWSPTLWDKSLNGGAGGFQADPKVDPYNLLDLASGQYAYFTDTIGTSGGKVIDPLGVPWNTADARLNAGSAADVTTTSTSARMTATVQPVKATSIKSGRKYLIWNWNQSDGSILMPSYFAKDNDLYESNGTTFKTNLRNSIITATASGTPAALANVVILEADDDGYFKWEVIVDLNAKALLAKMLKDDPDYGDKNKNENRAGQVENSVFYPVYLTAIEVSKATPFSAREIPLLPVDQKPPTGMYTINRKVAGIAATIGGEAGDTGPVSGVARVVLWFVRDGTPISWHEQKRGATTPLDAAGFITHTPGNGPVWWDNLDDGVIPSGVAKPAISESTNPTDCAKGVGASAIVIDTNAPTNGQDAWGQRLPTGFADGGMGKYWNVVINSFGITSGPVTLHYVVMDKAGNATHYEERLVIMNDAAVISRIKLATDIRDNGAFKTTTTGWMANASGQGFMGSQPSPSDSYTPTSVYPILDKIRGQFAAGTPEIQNGISDWISAAALGAVTGPPNIIDFNVRNNLFALRVETTAGPGPKKDRNFRLEYVSNVTLLKDAQLPSMKAGRIYIIDDPGTAKWGAIGADGQGPWPRGYAFLALIDGTVGGEAKISGTGSVWELNTTAPTVQIPDVSYLNNPSDVNKNAVGAEFVYAYTAFGSNLGTNIVDYGGSDAYPDPGVHLLTPAATRQSMFIIKVFDGPETDTFGDFAILRIRVNNNDMTKPFAQLYDINPKTEGQDRQNIASNETARSLAPMFIGEGTGSNRTKGGLWNTAPTLGAVAKPGHIEPRRMEGGNYGTTVYGTNKHSLSSAQMGGAASKGAATIQKPWADPAGFFEVDTVSGQVVLRGYAEDDQRIVQVVLSISGPDGTGNTDVTILEYRNNGPVQVGIPATYVPPQTGLLQVPPSAQIVGGIPKVYFADTIDLYRHRVEWAYIWDTETLASAVVGDDVRVRVTSYNRSGTAIPAGTKTPSDEILSTKTDIAHSNASEATKPNTSPFNPGFPVGMNKYNKISFNLRPYITGFLRNQAAHNTRSRQGRYMFARNETAVVTGFNLQNNTGSTVINLPGMSDFPTTAVSPIADYGIATQSTMRYRQFTVGATAASVMDTGVVTLRVNNFAAVNAGAERPRNTTPSPARPLAIQPWNIEYSPGKPGSELWDDFTQAHIWQSNSTGPGTDTSANGSGYFFTREYTKISNPAMSMDPRTGTLYESHNSSGGTSNDADWYNTSRTIKSSITTTSYDNPSRANYWVMQFSDPIFFSDVYRSPGGPGGSNPSAETWAVSSIIGRSGTNQYWRGLGGIFISGPGGGPIRFHGGGTGSTTGSPSAQNSTYSSSLYYGESTWYNASSDNTERTANPPSTDQFMNPHIVTSIVGTQEHIHVAYYDDLTGSIKYRYNLRGNPPANPAQEFATGTTTGTIDAANNATAATINAIPKQWTNLDGGFDAEDTDATSYIRGGAIAENLRVVNYATRSGKTPADRINAGKHNSIAVNSSGYPVIAYYDQTNQKLKLAVSTSVDPILASVWTIIDGISSFGTGEYVSMKIDTKNGANQVHIAAMNTNKRLVYITFRLNGTEITGKTEQIVDSVGNVGRWCALSLDSDGNPWISYMDESYLGARDGVKLAYKNTTTFYKGVTYCAGQYMDLLGEPIGGWETMHVPTAYCVENPISSGREHGRLGMECFPARNTDSETTKFWLGAVSYLSTDMGMDRYHIAYYVK